LTIAQIVVPHKAQHIPQMGDFFLAQTGDVLAGLV
jgi:hypothetical protein